MLKEIYINLYIYILNIYLHTHRSAAAVAIDRKSKVGSRTETEADSDIHRKDNRPKETKTAIATTRIKHREKKTTTNKAKKGHRRN